MGLSKYSNLKLLKQVAKNLHSSEDYKNIDGLCEKKLAELINRFYKVKYIIYCVIVKKLRIGNYYVLLYQI